MSDSNAPDTAPADTSLPVRAVTLFASGVAYVSREGDVPAGDASVTLTFRTTQINDILKSLVLLDEAGGAQAATYPSRDPVGRTLESFAVDVSTNRSRAELLREQRGANVRIQTQGSETLTGRIVGIESQEEAVGESLRTVEVISLLTEEGLAAVPLDRVRLLRFLDERLEREFREALTVLASGSDDNRRPVTLRFSGDRAREVRVGYIAEAPVWKVSYRLVLDSAATVRPYLQGWALVENTSDEDWSDIQLSLVSGRPVSFIQDLYQPLYVPRPIVPPDIVASPYPQRHGGALEGGGGAQGNEFGGAAGAAYAAYDAPPSPAPAASSYALGEMRKRSVSATALSAPAQAQGKDKGELFEYHIANPVSLPRQQAAMIPLVSEAVNGEKLSLYNPQTGDTRHPWNAVRVKNTTVLHLKSGPVTIFDSGIYAGDARMEDVPPGDERLLTYAVDLAVEAERQEQGVDTEEVNFTIRRGLLTITRRQRQRSVYTFRNKAKNARQLLVEHPFHAAWTLIEPQSPSERTAAWYRFALTVAPGETAHLTVTQERPESEVLALIDGGMNAIFTYMSGETLSPPIHEALAEVVKRRQQIQERDTEANTRERERATIGEEQERIRANMVALDRDTPLYRRYLDSLDGQETRLQTLRTEAERLRGEAQTLTLELYAFVDGLEIG